MPTRIAIALAISLALAFFQPKTFLGCAGNVVVFWGDSWDNNRKGAKMKLIEFSTEPPTMPGWYVCKGPTTNPLLCEVIRADDGTLWVMDPKPRQLDRTSRKWSTDRIEFI